MPLEKVNPPQEKDKVGKERGSSQVSARVLSSNVLKTTANFSLGLHVFSPLPGGSVCNEKSGFGRSGDSFCFCSWFSVHELCQFLYYS